MSSNSFGQKQCVLCNKIGGILICDGCQQTFCGKHVIEHRQQLNIELENIMQEHDLIQQDIRLTIDNDLLLKEIDKWEKESIRKIQITADKIRIDLKEIFECSNNEILKTCRNIASKLLYAREAENFSEIDLKKWTEQLNELKLQIKSLSMLHIIEDHNSPIYLIEIKQNNTINKSIRNKELLSSTLRKIEDRFIEGNGLAIIENDGLCIKHIDSDHKFIYFRGQKSYINGYHTLKFKIEQSTGSYNTFIGICSSDINLRQIMYHLTVVVGWFNTTEVWQHGRCIRNTKIQGSKNDEIKTNDIIQLIIDCENKQIELFHERTNKKHKVIVDSNQAPLPWKILLALRRKNDCVKILPNN
ncbi:unnamed protein product [Rotaria sp. Silwood1]|nr:unnamed protein product [Rotaria sp. Silwood1]CAF3575120.1 unnamed protein product [Rotaria sp. Silwood1]CAF3616141.1 unnamed protein product [Rotaria sp. Silwood1]CAF4544383.1 unnamed protein product [Rotaria sp. Silwood1]CAF4621068.1 unnamed protein product [Rotaria sp. Silwood1]